ncbi:MAG: VanZ family protein [Bacilli bacterium]
MVRSTFFDIMKNSWGSVIIFLSIITLLRITYLFSNKKKFVLHEEILNLIAISYLLLLFELVTDRDVNFGGINWIPFKEILRYDVGTTNFYKQVIGNIILFIPFGFFASYYVNIKRLGLITFITLISSTIIETVQYYIGRSFDIDDILLNLVGGILGFLVYIALDAIRKHLPSFLQKDIVYNILTICIVIVIVLYFMGTFKVWI